MGTFLAVRDDRGAVVELEVAAELRTVEERTAAVNSVFQRLRELEAFPCLSGWRDEVRTGHTVVYMYMTMGKCILVPVPIYM